MYVVCTIIRQVCVQVYCTCVLRIRFNFCNNASLVFMSMCCVCVVCVCDEYVGYLHDNSSVRTGVYIDVHVYIPLKYGLHMQGCMSTQVSIGVSR